MKNRLKKKAEQSKRKALHKILDQVLDINGIQASRKKITGDHPSAFFSFRGHVGKVEVSVHPNGYDRGSDTVYFNAMICRKPYAGDLTLEETIQELEQIKRETADRRGGSDHEQRHMPELPTQE